MPVHCHLQRRIIEIVNILCNIENTHVKHGESLKIFGKCVHLKINTDKILVSGSFLWILKCVSSEV